MGVSVFNSLDDLFDELLMEIIIRLPFDSVVRCKCISKRWLSFINTSNFAIQYIQRKPMFRDALVYHNGAEFTLIDYGSNKNRNPYFKKLYFSSSFLPKEEDHGGDGNDLRLTGSCNSLVLCRYDCLTSKSDRVVFYICNPLTKQWVALPPLEDQEGIGVDFMEEQLVGFICDDDYLNPRYKVVLFEQTQGGLISRARIHLFCSETGNWSTYDPVLPPGLEYCKSHANVVACNGMLHGLCRRQVFIYDPYNKPDKLKFIDLPEEVESDRILTACLEGSQGIIRLCYFSGPDGDVTLRVWELEDYSTCNWCFKSKINFRGLLYNGDRAIKACIIYENAAYFCLNYCIFFCNLRTKILKYLWIPKDAHPFAFPWPTPVPCAGKLDRVQIMDIQVQFDLRNRTYLK